MTFGLILSLANDNISIPFVPLTPIEEIDFVCEQQCAEKSSNRIKFIFGLTF